MTQTEKTEVPVKATIVERSEIFSSKARTTDAMSLVPLLLSISKSTRNLTQLKLRELGFHNGQDELLLALQEEIPVTVNRLAANLFVRPSTVSKMLDRLADQGLLKKLQHPNDARQTLVKITPTGLEARSQLLDMRQKLEDQILSDLGADADRTRHELAKLSALVHTRLMRLR